MAGRRSGAPPRPEVKSPTAEGTKVVMPTLRVGAADSRDAVGVIATDDEVPRDLLDALESELAVLLSVTLIVGVDEGGEVLDEDVLEQVLSPWDIAPKRLGLEQRQLRAHILLQRASERPCFSPELAVSSLATRLTNRFSGRRQAAPLSSIVIRHGQGSNAMTEFSTFGRTQASHIISGVSVESSSIVELTNALRRRLLIVRHFFF